MVSWNYFPTSKNQRQQPCRTHNKLEICPFFLYFFFTPLFVIPNMHLACVTPWASRTGKGFNGLETSAKCKKSSIHCREFFCITWPPARNQILQKKTNKSPAPKGGPNDLYGKSHRLTTRFNIFSTNKFVAETYCESHPRVGTERYGWKSRTAAACLLQSTCTLIWTEPASLQN